MSAGLITEIHRRVEAANRGENSRVIARLSSGWAVMGDSQFLRGYCLLLPDPVVPSLNDLSLPARARFLEDLTALGDAVIRVCTPRRLNYEILGNLEPALHAHIFPRYESEPADLRTKPVWLYPSTVWTDPALAFDPARHADLQRGLRTELSKSDLSRPTP